MSSHHSNANKDALSLFSAGLFPTTSTNNNNFLNLDNPNYNHVHIPNLTNTNTNTNPSNSSYYDNSVTRISPSTPSAAHSAPLPSSFPYPSVAHQYSHHLNSKEAPPPSFYANTNISQTKRNPLELFVGNLSYFCDERHLSQLFENFGVVQNARVMRSSDRSRSLLFGFVTLSTRREVEGISRLLNGHLFMGRHLRVESSDGGGGGGRPSVSRSGRFQVHITIASFFLTGQIIVPTETLLRKYFMRFGTLGDVVVNWYSSSPTSNKQEGYAFVTFEDYDSYAAVLLQPDHAIDGIIKLICTPSTGVAGRVDLRQHLADFNMHF